MFAIVTDSSANLDYKALSLENITVAPFSYNINGEEHSCPPVNGFDGTAYYDAMRNGAVVVTSQVTPHVFKEKMTPLLQKGLDVLFVGMSSGISGSYSSAEAAAKELREQYPERNIRLVDTLSASLGEGLLVLRAVELQRQGLDINGVADTLLAERYAMDQVFTIGDIRYLGRTGRISNVKAFIGSALDIRPILKGDDEGKIVCCAKVRGRKAALKALADMYDEYAVEPENQVIGIAHCDCMDDVRYLETLLRRNRPPKDIMTVCFEPVTGSHVGPDTVALFFMGRDRNI